MTTNAGNSPLSLLVALIFALPAAFLTLVAAGDGEVWADRHLTVLVQQHLPAWLDPGVDILNHAGEAPAAIAIAVALAAGLMAFRRFGDATLVLMAASAWAANAALKALAESPRPPGDLVALSHSPSGFGFPSGHVMGTTVLLALVACVARRLPSRACRVCVYAVLVILGMVAGVARVVVGAHWPSDVAGGYLWGIAFAAALLYVHGRARWHVAEMRLFERRPAAGDTLPSPAKQRA